MKYLKKFESSTTIKSKEGYYKTISEREYMLANFSDEQGPGGHGHVPNVPEKWLRTGEEKAVNHIPFTTQETKQIEDICREKSGIASWTYYFDTRFALDKTLYTIYWKRKDKYISIFNLEDIFGGRDESYYLEVGYMYSDTYRAYYKADQMDGLLELLSILIEI